MFLLEKFIKNYKWVMLVQCLVLLAATNLRRSKTKSIKAVNSPQVNKERAFHAHLSMASFCTVFQKCVLRQGFRLSLLLNLFLILHQVSGLCSYRIVLIRRKSIIDYFMQFCSYSLSYISV